MILPKERHASNLYRKMDKDEWQTAYQLTGQWNNTWTSIQTGICRTAKAMILHGSFGKSEQTEVHWMVLPGRVCWKWQEIGRYKIYVMCFYVLAYISFLKEFANMGISEKAKRFGFQKSVCMAVVAWTVMVWRFLQHQYLASEVFIVRQLLEAECY